MRDPSHSTVPEIFSSIISHAAYSMQDFNSALIMQGPFAYSGKRQQELILNWEVKLHSTFCKALEVPGSVATLDGVSTDRVDMRASS